MVPIPGTKRVKYLEENLGALDVTLTAEDLAELARIADPSNVTGARYNEAAMKASLALVLVYSSRGHPGGQLVQGLSSYLTSAISRFGSSYFQTTFHHTDGLLQKVSVQRTDSKGRAQA